MIAFAGEARFFEARRELAHFISRVANSVCNEGIHPEQRRRQRTPPSDLDVSGLNDGVEQKPGGLPERGASCP